MESTAFHQTAQPGAMVHSSHKTLHAETYDTTDSAATPHETVGVRRELSTIREELEVLKERRLALEAQRNRLLAATLPQHSASGVPSKGVASTAHHRDAHSCSRSSTGDVSHATATAGAVSHVHRDEGTDRPSTVRTNRTSRASSLLRNNSEWTSRTMANSALINQRQIPSEAQRRKRLEKNPYSEMKSRIREDCERDSMCRMGTFLLEDTSRVFTFGRERRFRPLPGEKDEYYLGTDKQIKQELNRRHRRRSHSSARVALLNETPGPGAYTPLYAKQSRPSVLTSLYY